MSGNLNNKNSDLRWSARLTPKLLLMAVSVIFTVTIVEAAARLVGWGDVVLFTPHQEWGFLMKPSQVVYTYGLPVRINSLGLRGPELKQPKPPQTKRIVFIGDSVTYGGGRIGEQQLFCRIVESRLRGWGLTVEAVNLSAPAWSPQNWYAYVQKNGLYYADMVILVLPECDLTRVFSTVTRGGHSDHKPNLRISAFAMKVFSQFSEDKLAAKQRKGDVIAANLNAVIGLRNKCADIHFLSVLIPSAVPHEPDEKLWSLFMEHLTPAIDLRYELQDPSYFTDGYHLTVAGHALVAERLSDSVYSALQGLATTVASP
jgi:lysophospholipase L1-like esterase